MFLLSLPLMKQCYNFFQIFFYQRLEIIDIFSKKNYYVSFIKKKILLHIYETYQSTYISHIIFFLDR